MASGRTLWDELTFRYCRGVRAVRGMQATWQTARRAVDARAVRGDARVPGDPGKGSALVARRQRALLPDVLEAADPGRRAARPRTRWSTTCPSTCAIRARELTSMTLQPTPADKFTFGLWTVGNRGRDPFGEFVRAAARPVRRRSGAWPSSAPGASTSTTTTWCRSTPPPPSATGSSRDFRRALEATGMTVPMATTNLFTDPVFKDGAFTSHDPQVRAYALQKTMRAMDLGVELGAKTYVFWGGREGAEVDAAKDPVEAIKRFRDAINFLCEYALDQGYDLRFALEAKPNEPRGDIYFPTTASYLGVHRHARAPGDGRRQPGSRARADGRPELLPRGRAGARSGQAVPHRPERSEAGPLRSGPALRVGVDQAAVLPGQAARGVGLRRPAPLRRARVSHRGRRGRVGLRARLHAHLPDPQGEGAAVRASNARFRRCSPRSAATAAEAIPSPLQPRGRASAQGAHVRSRRRSPRGGCPTSGSISSSSICCSASGDGPSAFAPAGASARQALPRTRLQHAEPDRHRHRSRRAPRRASSSRRRCTSTRPAALRHAARRAAAPSDPQRGVSSPVMWAEALDLMMARAGRQRPRRQPASPRSPGRRSSTAASISTRAPPPRWPRSIRRSRWRARSRRCSRVRSRRSGWTRARRRVRGDRGGRRRRRRRWRARTGSRAFERFTGPQIRKFAAADPGRHTRPPIGSISSARSWRRCSPGAHAPLDPGDASGTNLMDLTTGAWWTARGRSHRARTGGEAAGDRTLVDRRRHAVAVLAGATRAARGEGRRLVGRQPVQPDRRRPGARGARGDLARHERHPLRPDDGAARRSASAPATSSARRPATTWDSPASATDRSRASACATRTA